MIPPGLLTYSEIVGLAWLMVLHMDAVGWLRFRPTAYDTDSGFGYLLTSILGAAMRQVLAVKLLL